MRAELVVDERPICGGVWGEGSYADQHECNRPPGHPGRHSCICGSWRKGD